MAVIDALDTAPPGGHGELWVAARSVVRRCVCRLVARGIDPTRTLMVIADHGTVIAEFIHVVCPEVVVQVEDPLVGVLVGEQRQIAAAVLGGVTAYLATVPAGSFAVVTAPAGSNPMICMSRVVARRTLS